MPSLSLGQTDQVCRKDSPGLHLAQPVLPLICRHGIMPSVTNSCNFTYHCGDHQRVLLKFLQTVKYKFADPCSVFISEGLKVTFVKNGI